MKAEGDKPSESMKKGYETAKARVQAELETSLESSQEPASREAPSPNAGGAGRLPDLSNLASMLCGAGGAGGMSDLFNNPQLMQAAQQMMSNPAAMQNLMRAIEELFVKVEQNGELVKIAMFSQLVNSITVYLRFLEVNYILNE